MKGFIKVQDAHTHDNLTISLSDIKVIRQSKAKCSIETSSNVVHTLLPFSELEHMMIQASKDAQRPASVGEVITSISIIIITLLLVLQSI